MKRSLKLIALLVFVSFCLQASTAAQSGTEAPTGFDNLTNGFSRQTEHTKNSQAEDLIRSVGDRAMAKALVSLQQKPEQQELVSEQEPVRLPRKKSTEEIYRNAASGLTLLTPEEFSTPDSGEPR
jgi:hypothetical protein